MTADVRDRLRQLGEAHEGRFRGDVTAYDAYIYEAANGIPWLVAALTAVLDLADDLEADVGSDYASGIGSTIARPTAGRRIRAVVAAAGGDGE